MFWYGIAASAISAIFTIGAVANSDSKPGARVLGFALMAVVTGFAVSATVAFK